MKNYVKYPIEAFALAMVLFSSNMKDAMVFGITIVFGDILLKLLSEFINDKKTGCVIGLGLVFGTMNLMRYATEIEYSMLLLVELASLAIMVVKHHYFDSNEEIDFNETLFVDAWAYGITVLFAVVRQYFISSTIYNATLSTLPLVSESFSKTAFALIGAGIVLYIFNRIMNTQSDKDAALWVALPIIICAVPFILDNVNETVGMVIGIVMTFVMFYTFRTKLIFSNTSKYARGLPVELMTLGMIYMIVTIL